jgi:undecaprenyl diphosphate synthase
METTKPTCIGFIMDGNRRWAKDQGLPTLEGHKRGHEVFIEYVRFLRDEGIAHGVFYAFSTENWKRSKEEVDYLMGLFSAVLENLAKTLDEEGVRIRIVGRREDFSPELQTQMNELEEKSRAYTGTTIWIALSYGGRAEIVEAVNLAIAKGEPVDEVSFARLLWTAELPDPDIIMRTSGEQRLSNFLMWKSAYSELYFIDKHWPALSKTDFMDILSEYAKRERRQGA